MPRRDAETSAWRARLDQRAQQLLRTLPDQSLGRDPEDVPARVLAGMIDHTLLKPEATPAMIDVLCAEAADYGFASVCVNPVNVVRCAKALRGAQMPICSVVGFPLGATLPSIKAFEAQRAIEEGASEIDMVLNIGALVAGDWEAVKRDIEAVVAICHAQDAVCKVIIEAALLTAEQKVAACLLILDVGADYCKTSTGFGPGGAALQDVALMRHVVGPALGVKAAGGIRSYDTAVAMIAAGASRIGASAGIQIIAAAPVA